MGREPLLGQTPLKEGDAGAEVGEAVDPAGSLLAGQDLGERTGEVVAVAVHEVIAVAAELFAQLLKDLVHILGSEARKLTLVRSSEPMVGTHCLPVGGMLNS